MNDTRLTTCAVSNDKPETAHHFAIDPVHDRNTTVHDKISRSFSFYVIIDTETETPLNRNGGNEYERHQLRSFTATEAKTRIASDRLANT